VGRSLSTNYITIFIYLHTFEVRKYATMIDVVLYPQLLELRRGYTWVSRRLIRQSDLANVFSLMWWLLNPSALVSVILIVF